MSLFQNSVVEKYLNTLNKKVVLEQWTIYKNHFLNPGIQENIRNSKEEQYQGEFLIDLFVNVLGYTKNPTPNFNLTTELKNEKDSKKADGGIIISDKVVGVIELKGTNTTDLNKIEVQAFGYKNNQKDCVYVVTSNFEKLRFYIDNAIEYIEFNLFQLTENEFKLLYLCLAFETISKNIPKKIKDESISEEDRITKDLYKDYSIFKRELFNDLVVKNPKFDQLELFKKSQKLLDRFLFLFFAEDRQLLPPNSVRLILDDWKDLKEKDVYIPLYDRYKKYFEYLNTGYKGKRYDVFAYNGGLFKPDEILDNIKIDDDLLYKHTLKLATYDFKSEVDVNILGHIFENSLNELDEVKAQLDGTIIEKTTTKRKKDGVFYTPKYITKYIVENTVGKLCIEKKAEIEIIEEEYVFIKTIKTKLKRGEKAFPNEKKESLAEKLTIYRKWLLQITIIDPACGSGAFLNEALNFLIAEHTYIDELQAKLFGDAMVLSDVQKNILENNLFGVDLNEESVEIAKLSLWLRTAQPNRKLNDLNNNIKCGNSLIDDATIAGEKAFNWQNEFPQIFEKGGFDVVIGNPPYVRQELFKDIKPYLENNYKCYNSAADLYTYFIEKSIKQLRKPTGIYSVIVANKWMRANYGKELRIWLKNQNIVEIIDFKDLPVFTDATAYPCILTVEGDKITEQFTGVEVDNLSFTSLEQYVNAYKKTVDKNHLRDDGWSLANSNIMEIVSRLIIENTSLKDTINSKMFVGLKTGLNDAFIITKDFYEKLLSKSNKYTEIVKPYGVGRDLSRYGKPIIDKYIICIPNKWTDSKGAFENEINAWNWFDLEYNLISEHLKFYEEKAKIRSDQGKYWWEMRACDYYKEFETTKIIYPEIASQGRFSIDDNQTYFDMTSFIIGSDSKELLAILNSKLINFLFRQISSEIRGGFLRWKRQFVYNLPIPKSYENERISKSVLLIMNQINELKELSQKFQRTIQRKFEIEILPKKLQDWYLLSFADFVKELAKLKIKLTLSQEAEWEDYFVPEAKKMLDIKNEINATDKSIDKMVYELYGLSTEEIEIIEKS